MVVELLDDPLVLARSKGVNLVTGAGLDLTGIDAVIDVSNVATTSRRKSLGFFEPVTQNLLTAASRAGVTHHVVLSIIGVDRVGFGYYAGKLRQEELALASSVPTSVLRATQFHEFAMQLATRPGPVAFVPTMRSQPIAAREVAQALVDLAQGPAQGRVPDLAGPEVLEMPDLVRRYLKSRGSRRPVLPVKLPGGVGKAMATGGLLPLEDGPRGIQTWSDWLAATPLRPQP